MNIYYVKTRQTEMNNLYRLVTSTFVDWHLSSTSDKFLLDWVHVYLFVTSDHKSLEVIVRTAPMPREPDIALAIYQDIQTIPLMDFAITESKK